MTGFPLRSNTQIIFSPRRARRTRRGSIGSIEFVGLFGLFGLVGLFGFVELLEFVGFVGKAESPNQHPSQAKMIRHAVPVINNSNSGMGSSFILDRIFPAGPRQRDLRHNNGGQVRFTTTPFMTGFPLRSNTHGWPGLVSFSYPQA